jgi:hypothetical protein
MEQPTRFIGMDVHKDTIVVAVTAAGDVGKATPYGTFPNTAAALEKLVKRLRQAGSGPMKFCYEAGPCGYGVHRTLTKLGEDCMALPDNQQDSATRRPCGRSSSSIFPIFWRSNHREASAVIEQRDGPTGMGQDDAWKGDRLQLVNR